jgi:hypothetical protein
MYMCICVGLRERDAKVRADERVGMGPLWRGGVAEVEEALRDDLRAKVEALDAWEPLGTPLVVRDDVLALFDKEEK